MACPCSRATLQLRHFAKVQPLFVSQLRNGSSTSTVNEAEVAKFSSLSATWWDPRGQFAPLQHMNALRVPLVQEVAARVLQTPSETSQSDASSPPPPGANALNGVRILDIGCGGGLLSEPLARLGASVLGVDASSQSIDAARHHSSMEPELADRLRYQCGAAEDLSDHTSPFDIVVASEVIEHVSDQRAFIDTCCRLVRAGGAVVLTTLNKTCLSYSLGIVAAESLGLAPSGTHEWEKFISPDDLSMLLLNAKDATMRVELTRGMTFNPLTFRWSWSSAMPINYALVASKRQPAYSSSADGSSHSEQMQSS